MSTLPEFVWQYGRWKKVDIAYDGDVPLRQVALGSTLARGRRSAAGTEGQNFDAWAMSESGAMYRYHHSPSAWKRLKQAPQFVHFDISAASDGEVWGVAADGSVHRYRREVDAFELLSGGGDCNDQRAFLRVSVGSAYHVWGVSQDNGLYSWDDENSCWNEHCPIISKHINPSFGEGVAGLRESVPVLPKVRLRQSELSATSSNSAHGRANHPHAQSVIDMTTNQSLLSSRIEQRVSDRDIASTPQTAAKKRFLDVSASHTGLVWATTTEREVFQRVHFASSRWEQVFTPDGINGGGCISHTCVGNDLNVFGLDVETGDVLWWGGAGPFRPTSGPPSLSVSVHQNGTAWCLGHDGHVYTRTKRTLLLVRPTAYTHIWNDEKTCARPNDGGFWHPQFEKGAYALGSFGERSQLSQPLSYCFESPPSSTVFGVREDTSHPDYDPEAEPLLAMPVDYRRVWCDQGSGAKFGDMCVWEAIPPDGYASLGHVVYVGHTRKPPPDYIVCVRKSLLCRAVVYDDGRGRCLWTSQHTSSKEGLMSFWMLDGARGGLAAGTFLGNRSLSKPAATTKAYAFNLARCHPPFTTSVQG